MGRKQRAVQGSQGGESAAHDDDVTVATFSQSSRDMHVTVEKPPGSAYLCSLSMLARVPLGPDELYGLLTDPTQTQRIFTSLKRVVLRRVISDDGAGNRKVEVDQTGAWRFLMFRGAFTVRLIVEQRRADRTITFRLARPGFMRDFSGTWQIRPFDNSGLDAMVNNHRPSALHRLQSSLRAVEAQLGLGGVHQESLVQLQQSIAPALTPPKPVAKALQRIAAKQISKIMSDLQDEVKRINARASSSSTSTSSSGASGGESASGGSKGKGKGSSGAEVAAVAEAAAAAGKKEKRGKQKRGKRQEEEEGDAEGQPALDKRQLAAHLREL